MRAIREILRQRYEFGYSIRQISRSTGVSFGAVQDLVRKAGDQGLSWPLGDDLDDAALEATLYKYRQLPKGRPLPEMEEIDRQLRRRGVTLMLLWQEYKESHPDGYQYSVFCQAFRQWKKGQEPTMRQVHKAGERLFSDFAGMTVPYTDPLTGEVDQAHIFVSALGASQYTFCHAFAREDLQAWVLGHCLTFEFLGGAPQLAVPDNPKPVVIRASRYDPTLHPTFMEMAQHYGVVVSPARPGKPRDKAKVENAVLLVERLVLAPLRHRTFFSLAEVQAAIDLGVADLNRRPFQKREGSRHTLFLELDQPALGPLPTSRYDFALWKKARVSIDYHVEAERALYSVPYQFVHQEVDVRIGATTVQIFHRGKRLATHRRAVAKGSVSTDVAHMPSAHRRYAEWTPSRIIGWAEQTGPQTAELVGIIMSSRPHPEMGFRSCLGIARLGQRYGKERLEKASARSIAIGATSYRSVRSILEHGMDSLPLPSLAADQPRPVHQNIRGEAYFARQVME